MIFFKSLHRVRLEMIFLKSLHRVRLDDFQSLLRKVAREEDAAKESRWASAGRPLGASVRLHGGVHVDFVDGGPRRSRHDAGERWKDD